MLGKVKGKPRGRRSRSKVRGTGGGGVERQWGQIVLDICGHQRLMNREVRLCLKRFPLGVMRTESVREHR